jgi:hypothetical protein
MAEAEHKLAGVDDATVDTIEEAALSRFLSGDDESCRGN